MTSTTFCWDELSDDVCMEEDGNGNTIASFTHEAWLHSELIAQTRDGQTSVYNFDGQRSVRDLTDDTYTEEEE